MMNKLDNFKRLSEAHHELMDKFDAVMVRLEHKDELIEKLTLKIDSLEGTIKELRVKLAAKSKNSSTSSKPPSSDIVKDKPPGKKGKRKQGGQVGHEKHSRKPFGESDVTDWYCYSLDVCPVCSGNLSLALDKNQVIQQVEIVNTPIIVAEHVGLAYWCQKCGKYHYAPIPDDVRRAGLCGPTFTALIGYMKSALHASFTTIRKFVRDVLKVTISRSQLKRLVDKVGWSLDVPYDELLNKIPLETKLNIDETGHKDKGERFWTWCFKADLYTLFKIDKSRGSQVLIDVLGKEFDGIIGCDYFSAYRKYMKDFNVTVQFCLAHLIRDIRFLVTLPDKEEKEFAKRLLAEIKRMFKIIHERGEKPRHLVDQALKQVRDAIMTIAFEVPLKLDKNGKALKSKAVNITERLRKHGDSFFQFITTPEIDPTNNIAEQAIRFVVIDRYVTQGTRSEGGRRNCERLWTVLATCEMNGRSAFNFIRRAVGALMTSSSAPSLLEPDTG